MHAVKSSTLPLHCVTSVIYYDCLVPLSGLSLDELREWQFNCEAAYSLIERIQERVVDVAIISADKLMSASTAIHQLKAQGINAGRFVHAILEREIIPVKELPGYGLSGFAFLEEQITVFLHTHQPPKIKRAVDFGSAVRFLGEKLKQNEMMFTNCKKDSWKFAGDETEIYDPLSLARIAKVIYERQGIFKEECLVTYLD